MRRGPVVLDGACRPVARDDKVLRERIRVKTRDRQPVHIRADRHRVGHEGHPGRQHIGEGDFRAAFRHRDRHGIGHDLPDRRLGHVRALHDREEPARIGRYRVVIAVIVGRVAARPGALVVDAIRDPRLVAGKSAVEARPLQGGRVLDLLAHVRVVVDRRADPDHQGLAQCQIDAADGAEHIAGDGKRTGDIRAPDQRRVDRAAVEVQRQGVVEHQLERVRRRGRRVRDRQLVRQRVARIQMRRVRHDRLGDLQHGLHHRDVLAIVQVLARSVGVAVVVKVGGHVDRVGQRGLRAVVALVADDVLHERLVGQGEGRVMRRGPVVLDGACRPVARDDKVLRERIRVKTRDRQPVHIRADRHRVGHEGHPGRQHIGEGDFRAAFRHRDRHGIGHDLPDRRLGHVRALHDREEPARIGRYRVVIAVIVGRVAARPGALVVDAIRDPRLVAGKSAVEARPLQGGRVLDLLAHVRVVVDRRADPDHQGLAQCQIDAADGAEHIAGDGKRTGDIRAPDQRRVDRAAVEVQRQGVVEHQLERVRRRGRRVRDRQLVRQRVARIQMRRVRHDRLGDLQHGLHHRDGGFIVIIRINVIRRTIHRICQGCLASCYSRTRVHIGYQCLVGDKERIGFGNGRVIDCGVTAARVHRAGGRDRERLTDNVGCKTIYRDAVGIRHYRTACNIGLTCWQAINQGYVIGCSLHDRHFKLIGDNLTDRDIGSGCINFTGRRNRLDNRKWVSGGDTGISTDSIIVQYGIIGWRRVVLWVGHIRA